MARRYLLPPLFWSLLPRDQNHQVVPLTKIYTLRRLRVALAHTIPGVSSAWSSPSAHCSHPKWGPICSSPSRLSRPVVRTAMNFFPPKIPPWVTPNLVGTAVFIFLWHTQSKLPLTQLPFEKVLRFQESSVRERIFEIEERNDQRATAKKTVSIPFFLLVRTQWKFQLRFMSLQRHLCYIYAPFSGENCLLHCMNTYGRTHNV